ncbi:MAG: putative multidrug resistance protein MdtD [Chlamydiae bacterium]|nr:putative multidrug resistance protein MdtD [Chlamydiota bacterium]
MYKLIALSKSKRWWTLGALSGALSLAFLDQMNLPVALPTIQKELNLSTLTLQWLVNAYLLTWAVFVLTGGFLADFFGLRRIFCLGILIFAIASFGSSVSFSGWWFISFRAIQGFGTALMLPAAIGIIVSIFPEKQRGKAIGIYSGLASIFLVLGPLMGGVYTQFLSWRWIYWTNVPLALFSYLVIVLALPRIIPEHKKFDFWGFFFFTLGFPCFILALMQADTWGWKSGIILSLFLVSFISLFIFFYIERHVEFPFLDLKLFKSIRFLVSNFVFFVVQFLLILPVFWSMSLQRIMNLTPLHAGLFIMIAVLPLLIVIPLGGFLSDLTGPRIPVCLGLLLTLVSMAWFFCLPNMTSTLLIPGMICFGCGVSLIFAPISSAVVGGVPPEKRGLASGILGAIRQAGGTFGLSVISSMLMNIQKERFDYLIKTGSHQDLTVSNEEFDCINMYSTNKCNIAVENYQTLKAYAIDSYNFAFHWIYLLCGILTFIAFTAAFLAFTKKNRSKKASL